jgi:hypothetical protein
VRKLIIIYGSPGSAIDFTLGCLIQHPYCYGELPDTDTPIEYKTNESPLIDITDIGNYDHIEFLFDYYKVPEYCYLILKSPGYCFAWNYFNDSPFDCKYIYVTRSPYGIVDSMLKHKSCLDMCRSDIKGTDCPKNKRKFYKKLWNESNFEGKCLLRYHWYTTAIHPNMLKKSLILDQFQVKSVMPKTKNIIYNLVMYHLQLKDDEAVKDCFTMFRYKKLNTQLRQEIKTKSYNVMQALGEF